MGGRGTLGRGPLLKPPLLPELKLLLLPELKLLLPLLPEEDEKPLELLELLDLNPPPPLEPPPLEPPPLAIFLPPYIYTN